MIRKHWSDRACFYARKAGRRARREFNYSRPYQVGANSEMETIVFLMGADPKPRDDVVLAQTERAIALSDADNTDTVPTFLEVQ